MRIRALALLLLCTLLTGCYFEHPLTGGPSKDINSWLLGVWEGTRTPKAELIAQGLFRLPAIVTSSVFSSLGRKEARAGSVGI